MRISPSLLLIALLVLASFSEAFSQEKEGASLRTDSIEGTVLIYQDEDLTILDEIFGKFGAFSGSAAEVMLLLGAYFENSPYVEKSLEHEPEALVVNLREFDCTTFVESCLAISGTIISGDLKFERFQTELREIRYHKGLVDGYASRIHYFSDWIHINSQLEIIDDISRELGGVAFKKDINFMSTHPESYPQLSLDRGLVELISRQEQLISEREMYYIPKDRIRDIETDLKAGDIAGITTDIKGLDIIHVGVIWKKPDGSVHLLHASSKFKRVIISDESLEDYLANNRSASGIMVARPL